MTMTVKMLLTNAIALNDETDTTSYEATVLPKMNLVLAETFDLNNRVRHSNDKYKLTEIPYMTAIEDEIIPYEDELLRRVLMLGLFCRLYVAEDNIPMLSMYKQEYVSAITNSDRGMIKIKSY